MTNFLFSKTIGRFFCFLGLYMALSVNCFAAGFVDVTALSVSALPVIIGQNFNINFSLLEYHHDSKNFEYIEVWVQDENKTDIYMVKRWDNIFFLAGQMQYFSVATYLHQNRAPGDYHVVVRGKEYGGNPFNFGIAPTWDQITKNPYKFSVIASIKGDVIFSNLEPGDGTMCITSCHDFSVSIDYSLGMPFTVPLGKDFKLDFINVPVFSTPSIPTYIVSVKTDLGGYPGEVLEQFNFSNYLFSRDVVFLTGVSTRHPTLSAGTKYWLTAELPSSPEATHEQPAAYIIWWPYNNQGSVGPVAFRYWNSTWGIYSFETLGAFRIMGTPTSGISKTQPNINNISPESGLAGTAVAIKGKRFGATQDGSIVRFGLVQATTNSWSDNKIEAVAPSGPNGSVPVSVITASGASNTDKLFTYNAQPNITLNIQQVPILKKQEFKYDVQLQYLVADIAGSERQNLGNSDSCYLGMMDSVYANQAANIINLATDTLVSGILEASIGTITTGNLYGDFLLKFSANILGSLIRDEPIDEAAIKFVAENALGYIAGKAANSFYAGEFIEELTKKSINKLLKQEDGSEWSLKGNNSGTSYYQSGLMPLTEIDGQFYYNPYTWYTTGVVEVTCHQYNSSPTEKRWYVITYKTIEDKDTRVAKMVGGSFNARFLKFD